jgi:GPH family glycoside/pentoside/hexuronide:cation symporter
MRKLGRYVTYSMGNFANTIAYQVFGNRIQFYYVDILGLNAALAGVIWAVYGLWNAINDPLMGQLSDRTRTRMGRRVPYVLFGAVPLGLAFFLLWTPPGQSGWALAAYFLILLFIFDTLYSLTFIAYIALFPEVAPNLKERINLAAVREILATVALLLAFILAPIIAEEVGYVWMGAIMGVLVAAGYLISMIGIKEDTSQLKDDTVGLSESFKIALASRPFRWFIGANVAKEYIWLVLAAMLPFWRKYALGIQTEVDVSGVTLSGGDAEALLLGVPILLTIPALLLWRPLVARIGPRRAWIAASFCFIPGFTVIMLADSFYGGADRHPPCRAGAGRVDDHALPAALGSDRRRRRAPRLPPRGRLLRHQRRRDQAGLLCAGHSLRHGALAFRLHRRQRGAARQRGLGRALPDRRDAHHRLAADRVLHVEISVGNES